MFPLLPCCPSVRQRIQDGGNLHVLLRGERQAEALRSVTFLCIGISVEVFKSILNSPLVADAAAKPSFERFAALHVGSKSADR